MRKLVVGLIVGLSLLASHAHADVAKLYYGAGFSDGNVEIIGRDDTKSLGTVNLTVGLQLLDFIGVEVQLGNASDDSNSILNDPLVSYQAAMVRLGFRRGRFGAYVLGGHTLLDVDPSLNFSDSGTALGFGINLFGNDTTSLNVNFLRLDEEAFTTATIGFQYYFGGFR